MSTDLNDNIRLSFVYERTPVPYESSETPTRYKEEMTEGGQLGNDRKRKMNIMSNIIKKVKKTKEADTIAFERPPDKGECKYCRGRVGTYVSYKIMMSKDYGKNHPLLRVDVWSPSETPSTELAVPIDCGSNTSISSENETGWVDGVKSISPPDQIGRFEDDGKDRFLVHVDSENLDSFLRMANLDFHEEFLIYFLLAFPFYEHEWDIIGFVLDMVLDEDSEEELT